MSDPFEHLLSQASRGSEQAWSELFHAFAPGVLGFLRSMGAHEPEDLLSETFLHAARDMHTFRGDRQQFRNWIFTIARNRLIDASRQMKRRPHISYDPSVPQNEEQFTGGVDNMVISDDDVVHLLERLSPIEREIVSLRFISDLDVKTVAAILGKKPNTVTVLTRRALEKLHRFIT